MTLIFISSLPDIRFAPGWLLKPEPEDWESGGEAPGLTGLLTEAVNLKLAAERGLLKGIRGIWFHADSPDFEVALSP